MSGDVPNGVLDQLCVRAADDEDLLYAGEGETF